MDVDSSSNILTWKERLRIAIDAAQGQQVNYYHNPFLESFFFFYLWTLLINDVSILYGFM